jgi:hypothetical protein
VNSSRTTKPSPFAVFSLARFELAATLVRVTMKNMLAANTKMFLVFISFGFKYDSNLWPPNAGNEEI